MAPEADAPSTEPSNSGERDTLVDRVIDKYRIVRLIGRGGMGAVYEGVHTRIQKRVALKFIEPSVAHSREVVERFHREALAASAIDSRHIVEIFDSGVCEDGTPYLVMEYLPGCDLGQHLSAVGTMRFGPVLHLGVQILKALQRAHDRGIVHRDLKPDNVFLVDREGEESVVKLLDFGVSKMISRDGVPLETLTREGTVVGTPYYMSPEQAQALPDVDHRTDLYSVGAILYECLTGRPPHKGRSYEQVIVSICTRDPESPASVADDVPDAGAQVILRALSREREDRFESAGQFLDALIASAPDAVRDKYLAPLLALEEIAFRPATSSPSAAGSGATPSSESSGRARVTPAGSDEGTVADEFAETVRANSGAGTVEPSTLPSAALRAKLGGKAARWGLGLAVAGLAALLWVSLTGSDGSPPGPAEGVTPDASAATVESAADAAGAAPAPAPPATPSAAPSTSASASAALSPSSRESAHTAPPSPPTTRVRPPQTRPSSSAPLGPKPKPTTTATLSIWH